MDQVFKEEEKKLFETERLIGKEADDCEREIRRLNTEIHQFIPVDFHDIGIKKQMIAEQGFAVKRLEHLVQFKPCPYFARLDLEWKEKDGYKEGSFYIGKQGLAINSKEIVIDWRSAVGQFYYIKHQKSFMTKGITYSLLLRRALDIKNARLISYNTEYDGTQVSLEGDVIDPFLLTVLKDKRRQHRLTDIIKSIQENQNSIIRRPVDESFVVQGCAGSGKTMILLHRLSYLKFNNKGMSLAGVRIITPNRDFNLHIDDLSRELEIDSIEKLTVEEYYVSLINYYTKDLAVEPVVSSEGNLKSDLLGEIYSRSFIDQIIRQYHACWDSVLAEIDETKLRESFRMHGVRYPDTEKHNAMAAEMLGGRIHRIIEEVREDREALKEEKRRKEAVETELRQATGTYDRLLEETDEFRRVTLSLLQEEQQTLAEQIRQKTEELKSPMEEYRKLKDLESEASEKTGKAREEIDWIRSMYSSYTDYDTCSVMKDETVETIMQKNEDVIAGIQDAESQLDKLPAYNFVKRNALRKQIDTAKKQFADATGQYLDALIAEKEKQIAEQHGLSDEDFEKIRILEETVGAADAEIRQLKQRETACRESVSALSGSRAHERPALSSATTALSGGWLLDYETQTLSYYASNSETFASGTFVVDMSATRSRFAACLPDGGRILDFGCGAGRDIRAFLELGYSVDATDGSEELCRLASVNTGIQVRCELFGELDDVETYDGIWACASILHLPREELRDVLRKIFIALKPDGVLYTSFKYGDYEGMRNGRYFTCFTEETLAAFWKDVKGLRIFDQWITEDVRPDRKDEKWINLLARKA